MLHEIQSPPDALAERLNRQGGLYLRFWTTWISSILSCRWAKGTPATQHGPAPNDDRFDGGWTMRVRHCEHREAIQTCPVPVEKQPRQPGKGGFHSQSPPESWVAHPRLPNRSNLPAPAQVGYAISRIDRLTQSSKTPVIPLHSPPITRPTAVPNSRPKCCVGNVTVPVRRPTGHAHDGAPAFGTRLKTGDLHANHSLPGYRRPSSCRRTGTLNARGDLMGPAQALRMEGRQEGEARLMRWRLLALLCEPLPDSTKLQLNQATRPSWSRGPSAFSMPATAWTPCLPTQGIERPAPR